MFEIFIIITILFPAIVLHEYAHGWMAYKLGDPTAKFAGRLTLNPLKHVDPFGTLILPGILIVMRSLGFPVFPIGWAKPVPVNFSRLYKPKRDMIWVGLAGPGINIIIAVIASLLLRVDQLILLFPIFQFVAFINLLLAVFNLIPIPPLDGSRLVMGLLPNQYAISYSKLERYGILIVIVLINFGFFHKFIIPAVVFCGNLLGVQF